MTRLILIQLFLLAFSISFEQTSEGLPIANGPLIKELNAIRNNQKINADSAWHILTNWNTYPEITKMKKWYLFLYKDAIFGTVPIKVYIPENYKNIIPSPAILILHGAVSISSFKDAFSDTTSDEDLFYNYFSKRNVIIIRPFADEKIKFDWVENRFNGASNNNNPNLTFQTLVAIVNQLKQTLNIDDNKIFAMGHSDGSDGAFGLEVYKPSVFAGFIAYNSMLTNLNSYDIYLRNTLTVLYTWCIQIWMIYDPFNKPD